MDWSLPGWFELISSVAGLAGVWLNTRVSVWGWPVGIFSVVLAAIVYFQNHLFAEFGLQIFYAASGFYGWMLWKNPKNGSSAGIKQISKNLLLLSLFAGTAFGLALAWLLDHYTHADFPYPDSLITGFSLVGQMWLARKYLENWILWILVNVASVLLYIQKELWFFSCLYLVLLFLAVKGYLDWKKKLLTHSAN